MVCASHLNHLRPDESLSLIGRHRTEFAFVLGVGYTSCIPLACEWRGIVEIVEG
jgi:hypothetical protein